jgi:hypothetical protein
MVMVITLIALVLLLIGVAAAIKVVDTSGILVGNLAFRRDLTNRAETAIATGKAAFGPNGALYGDASHAADNAAANYSSVRLPTGPNGVPTVLLSDTAYSQKGYTKIDPSAANGYVTMRWVIDRQCVSPGAFSNTPSNLATCETVSNMGSDSKGSSQGLIRKPAGTTKPIFRISVRVTGPRNTEAYFQSTYAD